MSNVKTQALLIVSAALLSACAPFQTGGIRIGDTPARRIAKEASIQGKYVDGQCLPFAQALHAKFQAAGIPSKVISFRYETLPTPQELIFEPRAFAPLSDRGGLTGAHAMVVYEDQGRTYVMDNQSWQPKWIHEASATEMAQQFGGMNMSVGAAQVLENTSRPKVHSPHVAAGLPSFHTSAPALRPQLAVQSTRTRSHRHPLAVRSPRGSAVARHRLPLYLKGSLSAPTTSGLR